MPLQSSENSSSLAFLGLGKARGDLDIDADVKIAMAIPLDVLDALAFEPEHRAGLRAGGNFDRGPAIERGHLDFGAQRRLHKANRHLAKQVVAVPLEDLVRLYMEHHVEIAGGTAAPTSLAIARRAQS